MANEYFDMRDTINIKKLRQTINELPYICNEFFIGIEQSTSVLSRLGYASDLKIFFYFLSSQIPTFVDVDMQHFDYNNLSKVTTSDIELFLSFLSSYFYYNKHYKNSIKTKSRKLSSVKAFFKYNYNKNNIRNDPASKVKTPKLLEKPIIKLNQDEIETIIDIANYGCKSFSTRQQSYQTKTFKRDTAIISLFLGTGIRISELVGIDIDDINLEDNSFKVTRKGGNESILYFSEEVAIPLQNYLTERLENQNCNTNALFLSLQNKRITPRAVENLVKKYAKIASPLKAITPHKLRSTFGTALYNSTNDIYVVAEVLGHKDINTTKKHYASMSEQIKKDASKKIKLKKD